MIRYPSRDGWECSEGWYSLIEKMIDELNPLSENLDINIVQIKEKYGTLRVYIDNGTDDMYAVVDKYEIQSAKICEYCGEEASVRNNIGWHRTLCEQHYKEALKEFRKYWEFKDWKNYYIKLIRWGFFKWIKKIRKNFWFSS